MEAGSKSAFRVKTPVSLYSSHGTPPHSLCRLRPSPIQKCLMPGYLRGSARVDDLAPQELQEVHHLLNQLTRQYSQEHLKYHYVLLLGNWCLTMSDQLLIHTNPTYLSDLQVQLATLGSSESRNGQVFLAWVSIAKFSLASKERARRHSPRWWRMHRQVVSREITDNSLPQTPTRHCHGPLHLGLILKHIDPHPQVKPPGTLNLPPDVPPPDTFSCTKHGWLQSGNTSRSEKSSSSTSCGQIRQSWIEPVNPSTRVPGQLPSLSVGKPSKPDSS